MYDVSSGGDFQIAVAAANGMSPVTATVTISSVQAGWKGSINLNYSISGGPSADPQQEVISIGSHGSVTRYVTLTGQGQNCTFVALGTNSGNSTDTCRVPVPGLTIT